MFWFIVLLLLAGAGFYFYQKLMKIEREIRAEQEAEAARAAAAKAQQAEPEPIKAEPAKAAPVKKVEPATAAPAVAAGEESELESQIVAAVSNQPGLKQTELYTKFADINKKQLQQLLKEMADSGSLKREKKGSSYLVFPA
jgi:uncharacterized iron-regulated membrane protein